MWIITTRPALAVVFALLLAACEAAPPAPAGDSRRGQRLLAQYQCGACHSIPDVPGARARIGPPLTGFGRRSYIAGHLPMQPDTLLRWIVDPRSLVPGTVMPSMGASEADARDMAAYLLSLQ